MGHTQEATPMQTDSTTALGIANGTIKQWRTQAMDMWYYWIQDRVKQDQFHVYYGPSQDNLADYFTKHFVAKHHQLIRPTYLFMTTRAVLASSILWGCVETPVSGPNWDLTHST
jgi:hypothetical protein